MTGKSWATCDRQNKIGASLKGENRESNHIDNGATWDNRASHFPEGGNCERKHFDTEAT